ncbi:MAG TPA: 6-pyruvoyl-tetrahydropterin synthase-related protein, partial [Polyangiales bacterium]|nr:6-pyruvoyl-tetrahydropterin synthase-related protein [Polyangiales bacterium]
ADLGSGYGQPLFEFAPPLVYLSGLPFYLLGAKLTNALQWGLVLLHTLGAWAVYRLARRLGASSIAALGVVAAWLFAPYTALDLYVRGAFAEASAVAMAPVAFWQMHRCVGAGSIRSIATAALGVALVILGHNGAALLIMPALCALVIGLDATLRGRFAGACALALGLGLSAYFWLPALLEKSFVKTDLLREGFLHWSQHGVSWSQLLYSPWGHGLSVAGTDDGMSYAVGLPQLLLAAGGLAVALRARSYQRRFAAALGLIALTGMFLATTSSSAIWSRVPTLQYLAYPWRALMLPGLCLPLLSVWLLARLHTRWQLLAIAVVVFANIGHTEPKDYLTFDEEYYAPDSIAQKGITTATREEYAPRAADSSLTFTATKLLDPSGQLELLSQQLTTTRQEFRVQAAQPTRAELATLAYPGWTARIDDSETPLAVIEHRGTMTIDIPAGEHTVTLTLEPTPTRRWSAWLSLLVALSTLAAVSMSSLQAYTTAAGQRARASEVFGEHTGATDH